jgi:hypothetical protein
MSALAWTVVIPAAVALCIGLFLLARGWRVVAVGVADAAEQELLRHEPERCFCPRTAFDSQGEPNDSMCGRRARAAMSDLVQIETPPQIGPQQIEMDWDPAPLPERVLLVNASHPAYNLGLEKAANWWRRQGVEVLRASEYTPMFRPDAVWISAVFSWHVPALIFMAQSALSDGRLVEVGGPGTFGVREEIYRRTGLIPQSRPDPRFEREPGDYKMVFWSRGCPAKNCTLGFPRDGRPPVCSVPEMEGWKYTLYDWVSPAPLIGDNNISALPRTHQETIVERTLAKGFHKVDANSGFEPRSLYSRPWVVELWKCLPLVAWRFAYDESGEREPVLRTIALLDAAGIPRSRLHIYCLAGNEPMEECEARVREIVSWRALPIVQARRPLTWMEGPLPVLYDWTEEKLRAFQRWGNRFAKGMPFSEYRHNWSEYGRENRAQFSGELEFAG